MKAPADKSPDTQHQTAAHKAPQQQDRSDAELQFIDNRAEIASLRQLQETVDNSPRQFAQRQQHSRVQNASMGLQASSDDVTVQRIEDEEVLQGEFAAESSTQLAQPSDDKPNNTGLPDNLKAGVESLSGMSMDNVKVHYNSSEPAQLNAHAYAQGADIHLGPGQEQHLPHEAWHVVQQAQWRVKPTVQMKGGVGVNDDVGLEHEADLMGRKATSGVVQGVMEKSPRIESDPIGKKGKNDATHKRQKPRKEALTQSARINQKVVPKEVVQLETCEDTRKVLGEVQLWSNHAGKKATLCKLMKNYESEPPFDAYRLLGALKVAVQGLIKDLKDNRIVVNLDQQGDKVEAATKSLTAWLEQLSIDLVNFKSFDPRMLENDRETGQLIYADPPLTVDKARRVMDELRRAVIPKGDGVIVPADKEKKIGENIEWGMGVISTSNEAVIIAGKETSTDFSQFPYLIPLAHSHPFKPKGNESRCPLSEVFGFGKTSFALDLLPSRADVEQAIRRGVPQTVYVNYQLDPTPPTIVNPKMVEDEESAQLTDLPWIEYRIEVPIRNDRDELELILTMTAGEYAMPTRLIFKEKHTWWL